MIVKLTISNCIECPHHREYSDGHGVDGYTTISCSKTGSDLGETKTRWLMLGRSYIDMPSDCPLISSDDEYEE